MAARAGGLLLFLALWGCLGGLAVSAQNAERLAFDAATRDFELGQWERAAGSLTEFIAKYPRSPLKLEAAQRELFAQAEADFARDEFTGAAKGFAAYQQGYPGTPRAALAAVREAAARIRLGDRPGALAVLEAADGPFAKQLAAGGEPAVFFNGLLLKAEALRAEGRAADALAALAQAAPFARSPAEQWARLQSLAAAQEAAGQFEAAALTSEELSQALGESGASERRAETTAQAGRLWLRAGQADRAQAAFTRNAAAGTPPDLRREAVFQLADAALARGDFAGARAPLQEFLAASPAGADLAALRLRLGQALFHQYLATGLDTNATPNRASLLDQAGTQFQDGLTNGPPGELAGPLHLGRGWTLWEEAVASKNPERFRAALTNFAEAAALLPHGPAQATARFKLGDAWYRLQEPAAALTNYLAVVRDYPDLPVVQSELVAPALQQAALAAIEAGDNGAAGRVVEQLLARQPSAADAGGSTLLVGQALAKSGDNAGAQAVLQRYLAAYPDSPLAPEVELSLIATDLRARRWTNALPALDRWIGAHTNHPSLVRAEFDRAWASARSGRATNAVQQFAALAQRYPTNAISQTAALWLAGHYFSLGEYAPAEQACVSVVTNAAWRGTAGWYQARLWAAEAARRRQSLTTAQEQLLELLNDRATPPNLVPSAYFALGETQLEQPPVAGQPPLQNFQQALEAFTAAAQFTNSPVSVAALGKMADCHLQLATQATNSYAKADELYRRVLEAPTADLAARSKAAFGRGLVLEKVAAGYPAARAQPLLAEALNRYLDIVNGTLLRAGEVPDPWWVKEAGREAGRLLASEGRWNEAATLYDRLANELPTLRSFWELRAADARRRAAGGSATPVASAPPSP